MRDVDRNPGSAPRPVPRVRPAPVQRAFVGAPSGPRDVLALRRTAGNHAVRQLLAPVVQRCGDHVEPGCACAAGHEAAGETVQRDGDAGAQAYCFQPGNRRIPGSDADSIDGALKDDCLQEAYAIIYGHAMYGLLPLLEALQPRATYTKLRASAAGMGGPRLELAIAVVDLKLRGTPVTGGDVRGLVDRMGALPADQRRDILRYLGKLVVIDVMGFPVDFSYCKSSSGRACATEVKESIAFQDAIIPEWKACIGDKRLRDGGAVKAHVLKQLAAKGWTTEIAASTSASGKVTGNPQPVSHCEPIHTHATFVIHEPTHVNTRQHLVKKHGAGTPEFDAAWNGRDNWANDEVKAHSAERAFYVAVLKAIQTLEGKL